MDMKVIGKRIRQQRKIEGLTQEELAKKSGLSAMSIRRYESGERIAPKETIEKIANALDVPPIVIMTGETPEQQIEKLNNYVTGEKGIIAILKDIYGDIQAKRVESETGRIDYFLVGDGEKQFILYYDDIKTLYFSTKNSFPAIVDRIKDNRKESEVIKELLKKCNDETIYKF